MYEILRSYPSTEEGYTHYDLRIEIDGRTFEQTIHSNKTGDELIKQIKDYILHYKENLR